MLKVLKVCRVGREREREGLAPPLGLVTRWIMLPHTIPKSTLHRLAAALALVVAYEPAQRLAARVRAASAARGHPSADTANLASIARGRVARFSP